MVFRRVASERDALLAALPDLGARALMDFRDATVDVGLSRLDVLLDFLAATIAEISAVPGSAGAAEPAPSPGSSAGLSGQSAGASSGIFRPAPRCPSM